MLKVTSYYVDKNNNLVVLGKKNLNLGEDINLNVFGSNYKSKLTTQNSVLFKKNRFFYISNINPIFGSSEQLVSIYSNGLPTQTTTIKKILKPYFITVDGYSDNFYVVLIDKSFFLFGETDVYVSGDSNKKLKATIFTIDGVKVDEKEIVLSSNSWKVNFDKKYNSGKYKFVIKTISDDISRKNTTFTGIVNLEDQFKYINIIGDEKFYHELPISLFGYTSLTNESEIDINVYNATTNDIVSGITITINPIVDSRWSCVVSGSLPDGKYYVIANNITNQSEKLFFNINSSDVAAVDNFSLDMEKIFPSGIGVKWDEINAEGAPFTYHIYIDDDLVGKTKENEYIINGLDTSTTYNLKIKTTNIYGKESGFFSTTLQIVSPTYSYVFKVLDSNGDLIDLNLNVGGKIKMGSVEIDMSNLISINGSDGISVTGNIVSGTITIGKDNKFDSRTIVTNTSAAFLEKQLIVCDTDGNIKYLSLTELVSTILSNVYRESIYFETISTAWITGEYVMDLNKKIKENTQVQVFFNGQLLIKDKDYIVDENDSSKTKINLISNYGTGNVVIYYKY